jgi:hypothetical protein
MTPQQRVMNRLVTVFGEPRTPDVQGFFEEFARALNGYSPEALEAACNRVIETCTYWPKPAEMLEHLRPKVTYSHPTFRDPPTPAGYEPPTPEAKARVRALVERLHEVIAEKSSGDNATFPDVSRDAFKGMQRKSPNDHLHRKLD